MASLAKLQSLIEENHMLKNLVQETEADIEGILKKTHEESEKVKKIMDKIPSLAKIEKNDKAAQTNDGVSTMQCIYALESELIKIKDAILQISVENLENSKKLERRHKKNKALKDVQEDYKVRIGKLLSEKKKCSELLSTQKTLKSAMLSESLYMEENTSLINLLLSNQI